MGFGDLLKKAASEAAGAAKTAGGFTGGLAVKGYNSTIGEWGDRDRQDYDDPSAAARADAQTDAQVSRFTSGLQQPQEPETISPLRAAAMQWAAQNDHPYGTESSTSFGQIPTTDNQLLPFLVEQGEMEWNSLDEMGRQQRLARRQQYDLEQQFSESLVQDSMADLETLLGEDPDYENLNNERLLAQNVVAMIETSRDPVTREVTNEDVYGTAMHLLNEHQRLLQPHIELLQPGWFDENFVLDEGQSWFNRNVGQHGLTALQATLNVLEAPVRDVLESIAVAGLDPLTGEDSDDGLFSSGMWRGVGRGLQNLIPGIDYDKSKYDDVGGFMNLVDKNQSGGIGFREAIGSDDEGELFGSEFLGDLGDFAATMAIDPVSWVGMGTPAAAKTLGVTLARQGFKQLGDEGARIAGSITKKLFDPKIGLAKLDEIERGFLEKWVLDAATESAQTRAATLTGRARDKAFGNIDRAVRKSDSLQVRIDKAYARTMKAAENAPGGIRFAGQRVGGFGRLTNPSAKFTKVPLGPKAAAAARGVDEAGEDLLGLAPGPGIAPTQWAPTQQGQLLAGPTPEPMLADAIGALPPAGGTGRGWEDALPPGPQRAALAAGPQPPEGVDWMDVQSAVRKADDYLRRLSPKQRAEVDKLVSRWNPLKGPLTIKTKTQDAVFSAVDEALARGSHMASWKKRRVSGIFEGGADGVSTPAPNRFGKRITGTAADRRGAEAAKSMLPEPHSVFGPGAYPMPGGTVKVALQDKGLRSAVQKAGIYGIDSADQRIAKLLSMAHHSPYAEEAAAFLAKADELAARLGTSGADPRTLDEAAGLIDDAVETGAEWVDDVIPVLDELMIDQFTHYKPALIDKLTGTQGWVRRLLIPSKLRNSQPVRSRLVPRHKLEKAIDKQTADGVRMAMVEALGEANRLTENVRMRLQGKLGKRFVKQFPSPEAAMRWLSAALKDADHMAAARNTVIGKSDVSMKFLDTIVDIRREIFDTLDPELRKLLKVDEYITRRMSDAGLRALGDLDQREINALLAMENGTGQNLGLIAQAVKDEKDSFEVIRSNMDRFTNKRTIKPEVQDLFELNDSIREFFSHLNIEYAEDLFETDILANMAVRARSAYNSKLVDDQLRNMASLTDEVGGRLVVSVDDYGKANGSIHLRGPDVHGIEGWYIHKDVVEPFVQFNKVLVDPAKMAEAHNVIDNLQSMWARYATLSPGFHARNWVGNVFNAFLGGLKNPARYVDALDLQHKRHLIKRRMEREGLSFEQAAKALKLSDETTTLLRQLQQYQLSAGTVGDVFRDRHAAPLSRKELMDFSNQSIFNVTTWSRNAGQFIEHNARIALYLDAVGKGMSPAAAAAHVKEFLFDYSDLTDWEQSVRRYWSRFYTFMRKNTALQAKMLAQHPGRIHNAEKIVDAFQEVLYGEKAEDQSMVPPWARRAGMAHYSGGGLIDKAFGREATPGILGIETPFAAAVNTTEDIVGATTGWLEYLGVQPEWFPETIQEVAFFENGQRRIGAMLGLFSGLPKVAADVIYSQATGYDPFTGRLVGFSALEERDGERQNGFVTLSALLNPAIARGMRWGERLAADDNKVDPVYQFMNMMAGIQFYPDENAQNSARHMLRREVEALSKMLPDGALEYDDLVREGQLDIMNRALWVKAYKSPQEDTDEDGVPDYVEGLAGVVPKGFLDYLVRIHELDPTIVANRASVTLPRYGEDVPDGDLLSDITILEGAVQAIEELTNRKMSAEEIWFLMSLMPSIPSMEDLRGLGVEPGRDWGSEEELGRNPFVPEGTFGTEEEQAEDVRRTVDRLGSGIGFGFADAEVTSPIFTDVLKLEQQYDAAVAAGFFPEEGAFDQALAREMTRQELQVIFGEGVLSGFFWSGYDDRQEAIDRNEAFNDADTIRYFFTKRAKRPPTEAEVVELLIYMNEPATAQKALYNAGLISGVMPSPPSRENMVTDEEKLEGYLRNYFATRQGATGDRFMGPYPEADPRKSVELGGADWLYGDDRFADAPGFTVQGG